MAGLYLHIPFCKQACHYCDFHFSTSQAQRPAVIRAIVEELRMQRDYLKGEQVTTVYFGGGTPSLLTAAELALIFGTIQDSFVLDNPEITLEANPDDLTRAKLLEIKQHGINRLSIGIQSFDDSILQFLNRAHSAGDAMRCIEDARATGFDNVSIDLIYAIPGQNLERWKSNLDQGLSLSPEHLSSYGLTIEEKTAFGKWQQQGKLIAVADEAAAEQFEWLMERTEIAGYDHYEISNFSKPGSHSRHNSNYWKQEIYLGVGPSAHSYDKTSRQFNVSNNSLYLSSIGRRKIPFEKEILTEENKINEYIFTTLRTKWGCDLGKIEADFAVDLFAAHQDYITRLEGKKLIIIEGKILRLTRAGKLLADRIASDLFVTAKRES